VVEILELLAEWGIIAVGVGGFAHAGRLGVKMLH
jgi:hypothetical protein